MKEQYSLESGEFLHFEHPAKTESHTSCKARQKADHDASKSCKTLLTAVKVNQTLLSQSESLTSNPNDLVSLTALSHSRAHGQLASRSMLRI